MTWDHLLALEDRPDLKHRARAMGEGELRGHVVELIDQRRWLYLKAHPDSRRDRESTSGFPDLLIAGLGGVLFRELKNQSDTASRGQLAWGGVLRAAGQDWAIWRPADLLIGDIERALDALQYPRP